MLLSSLQSDMLTSRPLYTLMKVCRKQKAAKQSTPATPLVIILQQLQQEHVLAQPLLHAAKHLV